MAQGHATLALGRRRADGRAARTATTRWPATPATPRGPRAAAAATCRSRPTGRPSATTTRAARRATSRPTTRRSRATTCSSSAGTGRPRATSSRRCARPRRWCCPRPTSTASGSTSSSRRSRRPASRSQAFAPHFPHTVRKTETKTCTDCHLSEANDNNAIMAQLLLHGTNFVNFVGFNAWVGGEGGIEAVRVTEWDEPQAVIGCYLHRYAYPDWLRGAPEARAASCRGARPRTAAARSRCLQLRGEYLFVAEGSGGFASTTSPASPTRASPSGSSPRRSRRSATTPHVDTTQRDLRGAADQPADPPRPQPGRPDARGEPGAAVPPALQLRRRSPTPRRA